MSSEILREAAALMRSTATEAASDLHDVPTSPGVWRGIGTGYRLPIKAHIASWHPAVALAVADWLDSAASAYVADEPIIDAALEVATTYLGADR